MRPDKGTKTKAALKDRLAKKRAEIEERGKGKGLLHFPKAGTTRIRILPVGEEKDFAMEVVQFYLGPEIKGVFSPSTFGDPCPIMELYEKLKKSKKTEDQNTAKRLVPKRKYLVPAVLYKDEAGKEIDTESGVKLVQITGGLYGEIIDYYLDTDGGDFTDPKDGYDLKIKRVGTGKMDTAYTVRTCKPSALPKEFAKEVDLEKLVRSTIPSYEELLEVLEKFNDSEPDEDEEDDEPKKKSKDKPRRNRDV